MEGHCRVAWLLDIPGPKSSETIEIQNKLITNYETMVELYQGKEKTYDEVIYLREQRIILLQGALDALLMARETSFVRGAV